MAPPLKNRGPLLVDKIRGYFDRLPDWFRSQITVRVEKQKVDAKISELDLDALNSELKQEVTDEKLLSNTYLGDGEVGSGNDMGELPVSHPSEVVIQNTGQVAQVTETVGAMEDHLVEGPPLQDGKSEQVGDVWVTQRVEAPTFDKKVFQKSIDDLMPAEFRASVPKITETHVVDGEAAMPTLGPIDLVRQETQEKVGVKSQTVESRDTDGPTPSLVGQKIDNDFNGAVVDMLKTVVPVGTAINQTVGMTQGAVAPYDDKKSVKEIWTAASFPSLLLRTYDEELNMEVQTDLVVVNQGDAFVSNQLILGFKDTKIDSKHSLRSINKIPSLPPAFTEYSTQTITFPALLTYLSFQLVSLADATRKEVQWTAGIRAAFAAPTTMQVDTEFFFTRPVPAQLFVWRPSDIIFKGLSYSVNISNVLTDAWTNIGVSYTSDALYGNAVDRFSISATNPSATTYSQSIGQYRLVSVVVSKYKRFWVRKNTYIVML